MINNRIEIVLVNSTIHTEIMWKIAIVMGILVVAIYAAPQAPAEDKHEPVKNNNFEVINFQCLK